MVSTPTCLLTPRSPRSARSCTSCSCRRKVSPWHWSSITDVAETFAVPANMKLHAIPIFEFYDNAARYGPQAAGIPYLLSK